MAAALIERTSWLVGSIAVRSARLAIRYRGPKLAPPAQDVELESSDGLRIAATYWPGRHSDGPALLIVHGLAACRDVIAPNAAWFAAQGYGVLTIDLRGHGGSGPALHSFGWHESLDIHAALDWLKRRRSDAKIAVIGISMGGAAMLLGPRGPVPAEAFVLQAVFADIHRAIRSRIALVAGNKAALRFEPLLSNQSWQRIGVAPSKLSPIAVLPTLRCPVFIMGGEKDRFTPSEETRALFEAAHDPKTLWIVPHLGHKGLSDTLTQDYRDRVLAFVGAAIGDPES